MNFCLLKQAQETERKREKRKEEKKRESVYCFACVIFSGKREKED